MVKLISATLALLCLASSASAGGLTPRLIHDTGEFNCQRPMVVQTFRWVNPTGQLLSIKKAWIWEGLYAKSRGDIAASLWRDGDPNDFAFYPQEVYNDPATPHQVFFDFAPDGIELQPGQAILLIYGCNGRYPLAYPPYPADAPGDANSIAQVRAMIWTVP